LMRIKTFKIICAIKGLISSTNGINCIVCSGSSGSSCADPYTGGTSTSSAYSVTGYGSCYVSEY
jgi:TRAP-type C4-dicarboxylate transport system permease large subunit